MSTVGYRELFRDRDFRRLFSGHVLSLVGDHLYFVAGMWLVYTLTGSTVYTGAAGFLIRFPKALRALFGPLVDRARLKWVLVLSEGLQGIVVLAVPLAAATGHLSAWIVLGVMPALALVGEAAMPAQTAVLPRVVDDDALVRANSAIQVASQATRAVGRAAGGALVAALGAVALYVVDAVTFAVAALLFLSLAVPVREGVASSPSRGYVADMHEGVRVVAGSTLGYMVAAAALAGFLVSASMAVMPAYGDAIGGPAAYGLLVGAIGAGTLGGSIAASRVESLPLGRVTAAGFAAAAIAWAGAVAAPTAAVTATLFALAYVPVGVYNVLVKSVLQTGVPDDLLGRVGATVGSLTGVLGPLGLLVGGIVGDAIGPGRVLGAAAGGFLLLAGLWVAVPGLWRFPSVVEVEPGRFGVRPAEP